MSLDLLSLKSLNLISLHWFDKSLLVAESHLYLIVSVVSLDLMSLYWFIKSTVVTDYPLFSDSHESHQCLIVS